jgi:oxygen-independent coproporphyrinogen-3 oxidase
MDAYVKAVVQDIKYQIEYFKVTEIKTAYIGGGTPSVLGADRTAFLLEELNSIKAFKPEEFTIEANPESADEDFLSVCKDAGVNRISLGVQSFHEPSRLAVNRAGRADMLEKQLELAAKYFPGSFSADLITALPLQTEEILLNDIKKLLAFNPSHISLYSLTMENHSENEETDNLWIAGKNALVAAGFEHYEVSNFAMGGKRCRHNMRYWNMENWLGAGAAASGTTINENEGTAKRYTYEHDVEAYLQEPSIHRALCEELNKADLIEETLLMGYRCRGGVDKEKFQRRFNCRLEDRIGQTLERWKDKDIMLFLNTFLTEAFIELED